jgi:3-dehydroquinate synthase
MTRRFSLHGADIVVGAPLATSGADAIRAVAAGRRIAVVTDTQVAPKHGLPLAAALGVPPHDCFTVPAGEASKSREEWARLTDAMLARGFGRDSVVVAVGGGVVGDLAGFTAATYMRGVPVVQVPTSLLAMIDAAIGGKTGVDTAAGKNLVGAFHQPALVLADPVTLATLPTPHVRNGLAEALKHAAITGTDEFDWLLAAAPSMLRAGGPDMATAGELVERHVAIKVSVVARDEREASLRKVLNAGHTIGHAIETAVDYAMLHGECIGIGLRVEAAIAHALGIAPASLEPRITDALRRLDLPLRPRVTVSPQAILDATRSDKKARAGAVEYSLLTEIGTPAAADRAYGTPVPDAAVIAALEATLD